MTKAMQDTGERMVPESTYSDTFWEHIYRYAFACAHVRGKSILDIASGEGYGTNALSKVAKSAIGVDISGEAVAHAKKKYGLDFREGNAESIPLASESVDSIISFETIEHVPHPSAFLAEAHRVLKSDGVLFVSTPNRNVYHRDQAPNPFHCSELSRSEFTDILSKHFIVEKMYGQRFSSLPIENLQKTIGKLSNTLAYKVRQFIETSFKSKHLPIFAENDVAQRQRVIDSIPTLKPPLNELWNPYALREIDGDAAAEPVYFVAVVRKRAISN